MSKRARETRLWLTGVLPIMAGFYFSYMLRYGLALLVG